MRVMRGAVSDRPFLHGVGHGVRDVEVERLALLNGSRELFWYTSLGSHFFMTSSEKTIVPKRSGEIGHQMLPSWRAARERRWC